jgi:carbonic anhydrase
VSGIDTLYEWNQRHGGAGAVPGMRAEPRSGVVIVTCMDARVMPAVMFGVRLGDVHVLRNAGGIVTPDVIRSLLVSQLLLSTREVMVIMHTECGLLGADDRALRERARRVTGSLPAVDFMAFPRLVDRLEESVSELRRNRTVDAEVRGFILDVDTGVVAEHHVR